MEFELLLGTKQSLSNTKPIAFCTPCEKTINLHYNKEEKDTVNVWFRAEKRHVAVDFVNLWIEAISHESIHLLLCEIEDSTASNKYDNALIIYVSKHGIDELIELRM